MKVQFKQPRSIDGVDYSKGAHEVPDSLEGHWFFKACLVNGSIAILEKGGKSVVPPEVPKVPEAPKPAENYHEHMKNFESKADKAAKAQEAAPQGDAPAEPVVEKLDIKALQKQAKELGLKAGGKAAEIKARIDEHLSKGEAQTAQ